MLFHVETSVQISLFLSFLFFSGVMPNDPNPTGPILSREASFAFGRLGCFESNFTK